MGNKTNNNNCSKFNGTTTRAIMTSSYLCNSINYYNIRNYF